MIALLWLRGLVRARPARLLALTVGTAAAVGLIGSLGAFLSAAATTMTARSVARVAVDWQVEVEGSADPSAVLNTIRSDARTRHALPVGYAVTTGLGSNTGATTQNTGPGVIVGLPPGYLSTFPDEIRPLVGRPDGTVVTQQTAANLHVQPGSTVTISRAGLDPVSVTIDGVIDLPQADTLFQKVGAAPGSGPSAPPDNVVLLPLDRWEALAAPVATARPDQVTHQVHVRIAHDLPASPVDAFSAVSESARNLEAELAGGGRVGDNLAAALDAGRSDSLYAQVLFLLLGLPGAVIAGLLVSAMATAGADRRRREQGLLRARGATARRLSGLALVEGVAVGTSAIVLGLAAAALTGRLAFGSASFGADRRSAAVVLALAALAGLGIAVSVIVVPAVRNARSLTVAAARRTVGRRRLRAWPPVLAGGLLVVAAVVWVLARATGYQLILAPEGVPSVSVTTWALLGPLSLWVGGGLLCWWATAFAVVRLRGVLRAVARPVAGPLSGAVAAALVRQRSLVARATVVLALAGSFAIATSVFDATYRQQAEVDARLTNGADVTVTEPPAAQVGPGEASRLAQLAGVRHVEPLVHRFAYVGTDLQDLFGVRASSVVDATSLQNGYFSGGTARALVAQLAAQPDAILVSQETVKDFQLATGDRLRLRLRDARTGALVPVDFHYVGVVKEFPTAPRDSFLVANADYVAAQTRNVAVSAFLIDTGGSGVADVAARTRDAVGGSAAVTDIVSSRRVIGTSLTAVDLSGLTRIELAYAAVLAAAAAGVLLLLGIGERRRTFKVLASLGARTRQLASFVVVEVSAVVATGLVLGAVLGVALVNVLITVLTGVFDPAPEALAVPWDYLAAVAVTIAAAGAVATVSGVAAGRRGGLEVLRDGG